MSRGPYIRERQVEYWTSIEIQRFFTDVDYEVKSFPITQLLEGTWPSDFLFFSGSTSKIFGLQYKSLYHNSVDFWPLDLEQHQKLRLYPWMYYFLTELRNPGEHKAALHLSRIAPTNFKFKPQVDAYGPNIHRRYMRWGAFYRGLKECRYGSRISSEHDLYNALDIPDGGVIPEELRDFTELVLVELSKKRAVRFGTKS